MLRIVILSNYIEYKFANYNTPSIDIFKNLNILPLDKLVVDRIGVNNSNVNTYSNSFGDASARIWNVLQSKIEVNISLSKFKISLKLYLQENSLQLKYTK